MNSEVPRKKPGAAALTAAATHSRDSRALSPRWKGQWLVTKRCNAGLTLLRPHQARVPSAAPDDAESSSVPRPRALQPRAAARTLRASVICTISRAEAACVPCSCLVDSVSASALQRRPSAYPVSTPVHAYAPRACAGTGASSFSMLCDGPAGFSSLRPDGSSSSASAPRARNYGNY